MLILRVMRGNKFGVVSSTLTTVGINISQIALFLKYNNLVAVPQEHNIYIGRLKAIGY